MWVLSLTKVKELTFGSNPEKLPVNKYCYNLIPTTKSLFLPEQTLAQQVWIDQKLQQKRVIYFSRS